MLIVDNTFATPYHQKPLELGAHLVVHSATKALGGHNDLMAGAILGNKNDYDKLWFTRQAIGTTHDPYSASLLERGLKTFELRAKCMSDNALTMAEFLCKHPKIKRIFYPGLKSDPGYDISCKQMKNGFGGLMAFEVGETQEDAKKFITNLKTIYHAVSLGATETLVCIPYLTTMLYLPPERRTTFGVKENTVRLSAGIENKDILINDLKQALDSI
jgi:cystathionine beta-lyase/cystathionine gamma-synthase